MKTMFFQPLTCTLKKWKVMSRLIRTSFYVVGTMCYVTSSGFALKVIRSSSFCGDTTLKVVFGVKTSFSSCGWPTFAWTFVSGETTGSSFDTPASICWTADNSCLEISNNPTIWRNFSCFLTTCKTREWI